MEETFMSRRSQHVFSFSGGFSVLLNAHHMSTENRQNIDSHKTIKYESKISGEALT